MVRDAASSKLCGPCARPPEPQACFPRNPAILLHCLNESSRKKLLNALVESIFRCKIVEKRPKNMLPKVRVAADSKLCCILASFCHRRIPNLASLLTVPFHANLTVSQYVLYPHSLIIPLEGGDTPCVDQCIQKLLSRRFF